MAGTQSDIDQAISNVLRERAIAIGVFDHPTGKGDGREEILREVLAERVGTGFGVAKAEVIDSDGRSTAEHDVVIYDQTVASCLHVMGVRRIVRVESLAVTVEVKSQLSATTLVEADAIIENKLKPLQRHFFQTSAFDLRGRMLYEIATCLRDEEETAPQAAAIAQLVTNYDERSTDGLSPCEAHSSIPPTVNAVFAYDGPSMKTAAGYLRNSPHVRHLCVLGKYTISKAIELNGEPMIFGDEHDSLGAFLYLIEGELGVFRDSRFWFRPDSGRYYRPRST